MYCRRYIKKTYKNPTNEEPTTSDLVGILFYGKLERYPKLRRVLSS